MFFDVSYYCFSIMLYNLIFFITYNMDAMNFACNESFDCFVLLCIGK